MAAANWRTLKKLDAHIHILPDAVHTANPDADDVWMYADLRQYVQIMRENHIERAVIMPFNDPFLMSMEFTAGAVHRNLAEMKRRYPGRFYAFADIDVRNSRAETVDALCRAIAAECVRRGFQGVLADFESPAHTDRLSFLTQLTGQLSAHGLALFSPLTLPAEGAALLIGTGISGGSLRVLLEENINRYGAAHLALDLERVMMDFPLPCPTGCGTPLTREELLSLRQKHHSSVYFSRELMANYFTYSAERGTHFVLFDDEETLRQKVSLAQRLGIPSAFVMYPEIADLLQAK